ncbi:MAG: site-2 protease family protein [Dehalococcoidia bacterium]|nr:site-2 protease family protein [Dehalococcoidia bacterium]
MDLSGGLHIATIRGIKILVHWSWSLIFTLITWTLAQYFLDQYTQWSTAVAWMVAGATAIAFFLSVLLHELSHALLAQRYGMPVPSITLFIFGGVSNIAAEMRSARQEFFVAAAGPGMSLFLALVLGAIAVFVGGDVGEVLLYLASVNALLGLFNLLPGFPLDGGRVFRSIIWAKSHDLTKATRWASRVGQGIAWVMIAGGIFVTLTYSLTGIWYVFIGLFLKQAAESAYQQLMFDRALQNVRARDLMRAPTDPMPDTSSLQRIVDERVLARGERCVLLEHDGNVTGLLTTTDLARVPRDEWMTTSARNAMVPTGEVATIAPSTLVSDAVRTMAERDIHQLPVIDEGRLVGMLTRGDVLNHIQNRMQFADRPASMPSRNPVDRP